ncbi:hypothetical protein DIURU_001199 [Diutina rugosa]|uniref:3-hydroxy-3-methylglutaryl coenzyme A reductase n=1 Tax=Diutina rugosa TaxID=5481 RepID=A0A642UVC4_DIURU|nr:uncharacterized protein DIURU_001199 [Diutina rugosa]KAA8906017.1 hypothetical protein DIURU_001199 [Diutina rugosa]
MLDPIQRMMGAVARTAALKPIHFLVITSLVASVAYLQVVQDYIPAKYSAPGSAEYYYHPPGQKSAWQEVSSPLDYPDAEQYVVIPLRFVKCPVPDVPSSKEISPFERVLVVPADQYNETEYNSFTVDDIVVSARHPNRISKYWEYGRHAIYEARKLIASAESFDVALVVVAYLAMWYTIIKVFFDMKQVGSTFWVAFSTIVSGVFAFLFALYTSSSVLDCKVPPVSIAEGIPFLVATVGFKHKSSIAQAIMRQVSSPAPVSQIVSKAFASHSISLLRDTLVVIGALGAIAAYAPHLEGLRNFCVLSALILVFDLVLVYTFLAAILALKIEIRRAHRTQDLKEALEEEGIDSLMARQLASADSSGASTDSSLFDNDDNTVISFKVAMIASFIAIHALYLGSSWLYQSRDAQPIRFVTSETTEAASTLMKFGRHGAVARVMPTQVYTTGGTLIAIEDFILTVISGISSAIKDSFISKSLLFGFIVSLCINAYLLNASRHSARTTSMLMKRTLSSPKAVPSVTPKTPAPSKKSTTVANKTSSASEAITSTESSRTLDDCVSIMKEGNVRSLADSEVAALVSNGKLPLYALEKQLGDNLRAVVVRRKAMAQIANAPILDTDSLPYADYDYDRVFGACCENVIGFMPLPVGVAGPLIIDDTSYYIPMATTEGCLVASTMRGCKAINAGGGVTTVLTQDGMTRGPCVRFPNLKRAGAAKLWLDSDEGQEAIKKAFNSTSRFARLQHIKTAIAGDLLFIRFRTTTGDAMGMNMISKGVEHSLKAMTTEFGWDDMEVISVSGNYCTDKKPAAINWIEGRGKSIVAEAIIPAAAVQKVLKSDVDALVELNISKNLVGSAMAGSVGGFNAHAANLVTAVFLACGQDPAQNVESSNCITLMRKVGEDLHISVSMPSIEVGTIGGGTILEPQGAMLEMLGVRGPHPTNPGDNARQLAKIVASTVLAAELSLCSALAAGHLVQSHMQHNRKGAAAAPAQAAASEADIKRLTEGSVTCIKS